MESGSDVIIKDVVLDTVEDLVVAATPILILCIHAPLVPMCSDK